MSRSESPGVSAPGQGRVSYAEAGQAAREVFRRANGIRNDSGRGLTTIELKVLSAVVSQTATYSKLSDHVYLGEIAAFAYDVVTSEPWQQEKARKALKVLADHGLIERRPPKGRPNEGTGGPRYYVGLIPRGESQPHSGPHSFPESQPDSGQKFSPDPAGKSASFGPESQPDSGGPTEKSTEKVTEESTEKGSSSSKSRAPSTKGQGQERAEGSNNENLPDDEDVEGPESRSSAPSAQTHGRPQREKHLADGVELAREHGDSRIVWICPNCDVRTTMVPDTRCPQCDGGRLTKRQVAADKARRPPYAPKLKANDPRACSVEDCNRLRAAGTDRCPKHYDEKLRLQCAWPLDRPGGSERCTNTGRVYREGGRPFEPLQREDGWAPKLCDDHVAMLLDGSAPPADEAPSSVIARTEVPGAEQPDEWPEGAIECFNCLEPTQAYPCGVCGEDPSVDGTGFDGTLLTVEELLDRTTTETV